MSALTAPAHNALCFLCPFRVPTNNNQAYAGGSKRPWLCRCHVLGHTGPTRTPVTLSPTETLSHSTPVTPGLLGLCHTCPQ